MLQKRKWLLYVVVACLLMGCGDATPKAGGEDIEISDFQTIFVPEGVDSYDSADIAIVQEVDTENKKITFYNLSVSKCYTLEYDGTTKFFDKNRQSISGAQIAQGDVVDITFIKSKKHLNSACISDTAWTKEQVTDFKFSNSGKLMELAGEKYRITKNTKIYSEGRTVELMDVNSLDALRLVGVDHNIYSINVSTGHGYLRLENDTEILGGWIEVGQRVIKKITEDMLLVIPEGDYQVIVSYGNESITKNVSIIRDQETSLDLSDFQPEALKYGNIFFTINPQGALLSIDGEEVDAGAPVELAYGLHQLVASAEGYETLTKYFKVASQYATLSLRLEEEKEATASGNSVEKTSETKESESTTESKVSESKVAESTSESKAAETTAESKATNESKTVETKESTTVESKASDDPMDRRDITEESTAVSGTASATSYRVYIDSPNGAEVYLDGNYVGLVPVNFKKEAGSHTVTLRKSGYVTRSYTITLDDEQKDVSLSFSELVADEQ